MSTLIDELKNGERPGFLSQIASHESLDEETLIERVLSGRIVICRNRRHRFDPIAIGAGARIKVNANIGTSPTQCDFEDEIIKVKTAVDAGADTVMDLSIAGDISGFRRRVTEACNITLGTVPIYEAMIGLNHPSEMTLDRFLTVMQKQAEEGVDFMTIHSGLLWEHVPSAQKRVLGVVSRGGSIMVAWMKHHQRESFLYTHFDRILELAREYDITMSLGDGLRPGCTADANDAAQFGELEVLGELVQRCREAHVQVMVEGPGHVPYHLIEENVRRQKEICQGAPFYVLGPLVIDYAPGYDHIAGAIGGALAAWCGADFLCYVTPAEHLRLPTIEDVREGVIASKIAASAVDLARHHPREIERNLAMSEARQRFDWEGQQNLAIDPAKFCDYLEKVDPEAEGDPNQACSMCGEWCALKRANSR
ncbi:MAG: phosphomethylpyrimidine synthase ThiC [Desulfococcaceae bacterium]